MSRFFKILLATVLINTLCYSLRIHNHGVSHALAESPDQLSNLTQAEDTIRAKLSIIFSQIAAANSTINQNINIQKIENGTLKLVLANQSTLQDASTTKCVSFADDKSRDVQLYVASIESKIADVQKDIAALNSTSANKADLDYLRTKSIRLN